MRHWSLQISLCTDGAPSAGRHGIRIDLQPVAALLGGLLPVDGGVGDLVFVEPVEPDVLLMGGYLLYRTTGGRRPSGI